MMFACVLFSSIQHTNSIHTYSTLNVIVNAVKLQYYINNSHKKYVYNWTDIFLERAYVCNYKLESMVIRVSDLVVQTIFSRARK